MKMVGRDSTSNVGRFFVNNRQIAWVALFATLAWGVYGYTNMPKRKDPDIPVRIALAICPWPGISADKVEQLVTRKVEQAVTGNSKVDRVESTTQDNISVVTCRTAPAPSPGSAISAILPRSCSPWPVQVFQTWKSSYGPRVSSKLSRKRATENLPGALQSSFATRHQSLPPP